MKSATAKAHGDDSYLEGFARDRVKRRGSENERLKLLFSFTDGTFAVRDNGHCSGALKWFGSVKVVTDR